MIILPETLATTDTQKLQAQVRTQIIADINSLFGNMLSVFNTNMARVWAQGTLTPQQVLDGFSTDAGELFRLAGILQTAINSAHAGTVSTTTPATVTVNSDGTVTLS
jgi:hypothetical protein